MSVTRIYVGHTTTREKILGLGLFALIAVSGFLGTAVIGPGIYHAEVAKLDLSPGSIGSEADGRVPVVDSLEEMEKGTPFVLKNEEFGDWSRNSGQMIGEQYYNKITLKDGTIIAARIRYEAQQTEYIKEDGILQADKEHEIVTYPVGMMRPWPDGDQEAAAKADWITYKDGYLDMEGDFGADLPELKKLKEKYAMGMMAAAFVLGLAASAFIDLRLKKKEALASTPKNDQELWILGTYANWAQFFGQLNYKRKMDRPNTVVSPLYLGGCPRDEDSKKKTVRTLKQDWNIKSREELLETVDYMSIGNGFWNCETQSDRAWELCRSNQLLGMGFIAGWLSREEMIERSCKVGNIIQKVFLNWEELSQSYMDAYTQWRMQTYGQDGQSAVDMRRRIHENLWNRKDSPYRQPWMLPLGMDSARMNPVKEKTAEV